MVKTLNEWRGIGRLGRDPDTKVFQDGERIVRLTLACKDRFKNRLGEDKERIYWARICVSGRKTEWVEKNLKKGDRVLCGGRLEEHRWKDRNGTVRYATEVICDDFDGVMHLLAPSAHSCTKQAASPLSEKGACSERPPHTPETETTGQEEQGSNKCAFKTHEFEPRDSFPTHPPSS